MELKSGSFLAGLLQGSAGAIENYSRRKRAEEQYAARRRETEQFQMTERENARKIRADEKEEATAEKMQNFQTGMKSMQKMLSQKDLTPEQRAINRANLSEFSPAIASAYDEANRTLYKDQKPQWSAVDEPYLAKDGYVHRKVTKIDTNPDSDTYQTRFKNPDTGEDFVFEDIPISAGTTHNKNYTGAAGSSRENIAPKVQTLFNSRFARVGATRSEYESIQQQIDSAPDDFTKQKLQKKLEDVKTKRVAAAAVMQNEVENYFAANPAVAKAKKLDESLKGIKKDKAAYWNAVTKAYREGKIDNTDHMALHYKYESMFGELPPQSEQPERLPETDDEPTPQRSQPAPQAKPKAKWKLE